MSHSSTTTCVAPTYIYASEPNSERATFAAIFSFSILDAIDADTSTTTSIGFCSRDPIGYFGHTFSLYEYCASTPTYFVDPSGYYEIVPPFDDWPRKGFPLKLPTFPDIGPRYPGPPSPPEPTADPAKNCESRFDYEKDLCEHGEGFCWRICRCHFFKNACMRDCDTLNSCCELNAEINRLACRANAGLISNADAKKDIDLKVKKGVELGCATLTVTGGGGSQSGPTPVSPIDPIQPIPAPGPGYEPDWRIPLVPN